MTIEELLTLRVQTMKALEAIEDAIKVERVKASQANSCKHKNAQCVGIHPHRGEEFMRCPDCGKEWIE